MNGPVFGGYGGYPDVQAKTASYQLKSTDFAKIFTNKAATGAVVFTLPAIAGLPTGWTATFVSAVVAQDFSVTSSAGSDMVVNGVITGSTILLSRAGGVIKVTFDGTLWLCEVSEGGYPTVTAKTASYQVLESDYGVHFTNKGAGGAVTFTLPPIAGLVSGWHATFSSAVLAQNFIIASSDGNDMIAMNDIAASSLTFSTASEIAGATVKCTFDGALWICEINLGTDGQTVTIT